MPKKWIISTALIGLSWLTACNQPDFELARVHDSGSIAADGCGWVIIMDDSQIMYKPDNLPQKYEQENLAVRIRYNIIANNAGCGISPDGPAEINILKIETRE